MNGAERIAAERKRQIEEEGWDAEHDAKHTYFQLSYAAACYAAAPDKIYCVEWKTDGDHSPGHNGTIAWVDVWPWDPKWDKRNKHSRIRRLEIAGALCAAEIDQILRKDKVDDD